MIKDWFNHQKYITNLINVLSSFGIVLTHSIKDQVCRSGESLFHIDITSLVWGRKDGNPVEKKELGFDSGFGQW